MRTALLCVFITLIVQREGSLAVDDFKPIPIPLNDWHYEWRESRAGTLHETVHTSSPSSVAIVPAHYWEDALRHSVYLTLVRDKIDQLITQGDVISLDSQPDHASKEVTDHDLWDKIKSAPFDRINEVEPASFGDVTVMAKGRLMEEEGSFRFTEDERTKDKCADDRCMEGVKAIWSVKRVRQRDMETIPGRYHYELTFSVISHKPQQQRKPYENPVRTFTVRETDPERVVDSPQEHRSYEPIQALTQRPERAIWFHKNIFRTLPTKHQGRQYQHGLDRIFSSLFSDEDDYEPPIRYRINTQIPPVYPQYSKVGYVGSPSDQQKKLTPYPYKPHSYKYSRQPLPPPPYSHMQHYVEADNNGVVNGPYASQQDHRYVTPNKSVKTTRPAVLPTPVLPPRNWTVDGDKKKPNTTDNTTKSPEITTVYKNYNRPRPGPMKINYLPDHVRPPIYNAPPGVFVTMDKKPFKPMPPMKLISKPLKQHKPIDFRPSPQVLDMQQFSEPDPFIETAFRPITWNYSHTNTTTEKIEVAESSTLTNNTRKPNTKGKKPPKKHENIKSQRITTSTPEIITASSTSEEETDTLQWANVVGAFTKTTPMASQKEKPASESTSSSTTPTSVSTTLVRKKTTTTTEAIEEPTTTPKPKKRTRPPPKFTKPDKVKKHKRITTTTTKAPEQVKTTLDLTPQASSAAATKPAWSTTNKSTITTPETTSTTTTARPTITTPRVTTTTQTQGTTEVKQTTLTTQLNTNKNRFRQTTLMQKGTSVNHDKWSNSASTEKVRTTASFNNIPRRKGSNFQGYVSSSTSQISDKNHKNDHQDHVPSTVKISSTAEATTKPVSSTKPTGPSYEDITDQYEINSESSDYSNVQEEYDDDDKEQDLERDEHNSRDHIEYIFETSTTPSERTNDINEYEDVTTEQIITSLHSIPKNKTKCKKKKYQNVTNTEELESQSTSKIQNEPVPSTTTESAVTSSIFEDLFGAFTLDDSIVKKDSQLRSKPEPDEQGSENHQQYAKIDDDLQDFLDSLNDEKPTDEKDEEYEEEETEPSIDEEDSPFDYEHESISARGSDGDEDEYHDHPYSLFGLMAMD